MPCIFATVSVLVMSEGEGDDGDGDGESEGTPPKYMRDVREEEDRGLERRAVRRGGCKTQKLRFSLACSVEALFTRSECHHELAPMRAHSYVMDGGELQLERATGKTKQQLSESSGSDVSQNEQLIVGFRPRAKSRLLCTTRVRFRLLQLCVCDLGVG